MAIFYVTKYALTEGIIEVESEVEIFRDGVSYISEKLGYGGHRYFNGEGNEWHRTREAAVKKADEMRVKRITSLQRQIAKLGKMTFE